MGPSERRADGGFPSVPGVIFTNWRERLNAAALPGAVRAGYTLAIAGYLDYCRRNGISVTLESARGYMADVTRRGLARNPPLWKQGLNWYFGEGRKTSGRQLRGVPSVGQADTGKTDWERRMIERLRLGQYAWRTEQTYRKDNMGWSGWEEFRNLTPNDKTNLQEQEKKSRRRRSKLRFPRNQKLKRWSRPY